LRDITITKETVDSEDSAVLWQLLQNCTSAGAAWIKTAKNRIRTGHVTATFKEIDVAQQCWMGELLIQMQLGELSAFVVVNELMWGCYADEQHMTDSKTLRLWWD